MSTPSSCQSVLTMEQGGGSQAEHVVLFEETEIVVREWLRNLKAVRWSPGKVSCAEKICSRSLLWVPFSLC